MKTKSDSEIAEKTERETEQNNDSTEQNNDSNFIKEYANVSMALTLLLTLALLLTGILNGVANSLESTIFLIFAVISLTSQAIFMFVSRKKFEISKNKQKKSFSSGNKLLMIMYYVSVSSTFLFLIVKGILLF